MSPLISRKSNKIRLYEALGQIVVSFGALELAVEAIIFCATPGTVMQAKVLLRNMSFANKVATMNRILRELYSEQELGNFSIALNEFVERSYYCENQRNEWLCSYWIPELDSEVDAIFRLQPNPEQQKMLRPEKISLAVIESFIVCLDATVLYLHAFHRRLFISLGRLRDCSAFNEYLRTSLHVSNDSGCDEFFLESK